MMGFVGGTLAALAVLALCLLIAGGCGGEDEQAPTTVAEADLSSDGTFWAELAPELKRELAAICQGRQVSEEPRPRVAISIQQIDTDDYVAEIDSLYAEEGTRATINSACERARIAIASGNIDELLPHLEK